MPGFIMVLNVMTIGAAKAANSTAWNTVTWTAGDVVGKHGNEKREEHRTLHPLHSTYREDWSICQVSEAHIRLWFPAFNLPTGIVFRPCAQPQRSVRVFEHQPLNHGGGLGIEPQPEGPPVVLDQPDALVIFPVRHRDLRLAVVGLEQPFQPRKPLPQALADEIVAILDQRSKRTIVSLTPTPFECSSSPTKT